MAEFSPTPVPTESDDDTAATRRGPCGMCSLDGEFVETEDGRCWKCANCGVTYDTREAAAEADLD